MTRILFSSAALMTVFAVAGCCGPVIEEPAEAETSEALPLNDGLAVFGFVETEHGTGLPDAEICVVDGSVRCATSDTDGSFTLRGISADTNVVVTFEKKGFTPMLSPVQMGREQVVLSPRMRALVDGRSFMGTQANSSEGQLEFSVTAPPTGHATVSVTLTDLNGRTRAPLYLGHDGKVSLEATYGLRGGFTDLETGDYLLTVSGGSAKCAATDSGFSSGYFSGSPAVAPVDPTGDSVTVVVPVIDGYLTGPVRVSCASSGGGECVLGGAGNQIALELR